MQIKWRFIGQMMLVFIAAMLFFHFIRYFDLGEQKAFVLNSPAGRLAFLVTLGGIGGFAFAMIELALDRPSLKRLSYGRLLVFKAILYFILVKLIMWIGLIILTRRSPLDLDLNWAIEMMNSRAFWVALAYFSVVIFLITFFRAVDQKFGPGVLWNMLLGKYHHPQEEQRIFMFLDLKSSTTIAEELGHLRFSRFIQDCFYDLNEIVPQFKAEIYQYVGDEAVLTWDKQHGFTNNNCLEIYFAFRHQLLAKKDYYLEQYGVVPEFKAGLHHGKVMVAEVGVVKKEIAFHGDVLNTAARIQGQCNEYQQYLLISKDLLQQLNIGSHLNSTFIGAIPLKGKMIDVPIYGIQKR